MTFWLTGTAAVASALMGGVFFAFSSFDMPALGRIPPAERIRAMQRINIDVFHWSFMVVFFGTPAACIALTAQALQDWNDSGAPFTIAGSAGRVTRSHTLTAEIYLPHFSLRTARRISSTA